MWNSLYVTVDVKSILADVETDFKEISTEECEKFDKQTLVNVNDMRMKSTCKMKDVEISHGYILVTILVAAEGEHMLHSNKCSTDLKTSLENLGSIITKNLMGVEVLWTPQQENDRLSEQELNEDYPLFSQPFVLGMFGEMDDEYCL